MKINNTTNFKDGSILVNFTGLNDLPITVTIKNHKLYNEFPLNNSEEMFLEYELDIDLLFSYGNEERPSINDEVSIMPDAKTVSITDLNWNGIDTLTIKTKRIAFGGVIEGGYAFNCHSFESIQLCYDQFKKDLAQCGQALIEFTGEV